MVVHGVVPGVLWETFGVFLLPAGVFVAGLALYAVLWWIGRVGDGDRD